MTKEKNEALGKVLELEALNAEREKQLKLLEAKMKCVKDVHEAENIKIWQESAEAAASLEVVKLKTEDLSTEGDHLRQLNENFHILRRNIFTLANRCCNELEKTFSSARAKS